MYNTPTGHFDSEGLALGLYFLHSVLESQKGHLVLDDRILTFALPCRESLKKAHHWIRVPGKGEGTARDPQSFLLVPLVISFAGDWCFNL